MKRKKCCNCKKIKALSCFYNNRNTKDGFHYRCVDCAREQARENKRRERQRNPEKFRRIAREWRNKHPEEAKIKGKEYRLKIRRGVIEHYGGKCACCNEGETKFLALDHINNNGTEERKRLGLTSGFGFYIYVTKNNFPRRYQLLCHNCNMAKGLYGGCPHKKYDINKVNK